MALIGRALKDVIMPLISLAFSTFVKTVSFGSVIQHLYCFFHIYFFFLFSFQTAEINATGMLPHNVIITALRCVYFYDSLTLNGAKKIQKLGRSFLCLFTLNLCRFFFFKEFPSRYILLQLFIPVRWNSNNWNRRFSISDSI